MATGDYKMIMYGSVPRSPSDGDFGNRFHSVSFGGTSGDFVESRNTFSTWHLIPESVPIVELPEQKKQTVDIPGSNGVLDLSMSLTKFPIFNRRSGSMTFTFIPGFSNNTTIQDSIIYYLHGKKRRMVLEDDPDYYYIGYFSVKITNNTDSSPSTVEISYDLEPYRYSTKIIYMDIEKCDSTTKYAIYGTSNYNGATGTGRTSYAFKNTNDSNSPTYSHTTTTNQQFAYKTESISSDYTLPTPLIIEIESITPNSILDVGFRNTYLGINELSLTILNSYAVPRYNISTTGTHIINKYSICGIPSSYDIVMEFDYMTFSTASQRAVKMRAGYRKAKI